ncbi:DUF3080 domain-containing protein [Aestuariibacter salexigens]|uniref:DUF3080 domain-containing protein n=1 Tax=Aestuariibacter salexigens TaxID=226010 RepID=UPI0005595A9E|nr:DUF3080 domain-containing protein [Aestuariibacter salexigens]
MTAAYRYALLVTTLLLASCNEKMQLHDDLNEYRQRLANVLDSVPPAITDITPLTLPPLAELRPDIENMTMQLSDFYALQDCPVNTLIAERNTSLGRAQHPSSRFVYEVTLLESLESCLTQIEDEAIAGTLEKWLKQKTQQLPLVWADLIAGSEEVYLGLTRSSAYVAGDDSDGMTSTRAAFSYLLSLSSKPSNDSDVLEQHLQQLIEYRLPARLWRTQLLVSHHLSVMTQWLKQIEGDIQCPNGKAIQKAKYLVNVFNLFFIEKIQPVLGQVNRYHYQLAPIIEELAHHPALPEALTTFLQTNIDERFNRYQQSVHTHITWWQALFSRCGVRPGV